MYTRSAIHIRGKSNIQSSVDANRKAKHLISNSKTIGSKTRQSSEGHTINNLMYRQTKLIRQLTQQNKQSSLSKMKFMTASCKLSKPKNFYASIKHKPANC